MVEVKLPPLDPLHPNVPNNLAIAIGHHALFTRDFAQADDRLPPVSLDELGKVCRQWGEGRCERAVERWGWLERELGVSVG